MKKTIELLAPARTAEIGIEAILHGADAVYIGAHEFSARSAASNSIDDIRRLCTFAHIYGAKVYIAMNTLLYDNELKKAEELAWDLYHAGADALIIQDMAFLMMNLPPIPLHASTQCDIRTKEKARFLEEVGFKQLVLARELTLEQITEISNHINIPVEVFIHGALCVSYSGQCYASQYSCQRSANRGKCSQFCRLAFDLVDANGNTIIKDKHLLSLRDMNRSEHLEEMIRLGVRSFKIEGRLKDISYVKNITAYYRERIDKILALPEFNENYSRSSFGTSKFTFKPAPEKSFNRGFTDYFISKGKTDIYNINTPKSHGEQIGVVEHLKQKSFKCSQEIHAGDGLCFYNDEERLEGFRVNKVENGNIFPAKMPHLRPGTVLYRNHNQTFESLLSHTSATRKIKLWMLLKDCTDGFIIECKDETGRCASLQINSIHEIAKTPQSENIRKQFSKLGETPFALQDLTIDMKENWFIPSSILSDWRRRTIETLLATPPHSNQTNNTASKRIIQPKRNEGTNSTDIKNLDYLANVTNGLSRKFYEIHGATSIDWGYEINPPKKAAIMFCNHCIRNMIGACRKTNPSKILKEPLSLRHPDGRLFPLEFKCSTCQMIVYTPN